MSNPGGQPVFQPESLAELTRFVQYMFAGVDKQLNHITSKLDELDVVSRDQHRADVDALKEELKEQKQELSDYQTKLAAYGRWFVSSLIIPAIAIAVTIYNLANGGN